MGYDKKKDFLKSLTTKETLKTARGEHGSRYWSVTMVSLFIVTQMFISGENGTVASLMRAADLWH